MRGRLQRLSLPFEDWPSLDQKLWTEAFRSSSRKARRRLPKSLRKATIKSLRFDYGFSIGWLKQARYLDPSAPPASRWPPEVLSAYQEYLSGRCGPRTVHTRIGRLSYVLKMITPELDLGHFQETIAQIYRPPLKIRPIIYEVQAQDLLRLGKKLVDTSHYCPTPLERALEFRDGLAITCLTFRPWRLSVFSGLELDLSMERLATHWHLFAPGRLTKSGRAASAVAPHQLNRLLDEYVQIHRPVLCQGRYTGRALWVSVRGGPLSSRAMHEVFCRRTRAEFGSHIPPHLFRKISATTLAEHKPEHAQHIRGLLGHADRKVGEQYYNMARDFVSFDALGVTLEQLRSSK